jgi:hypothetical protein
MSIREARLTINQLSIGGAYHPTDWLLADFPVGTPQKYLKIMLF